MTGLAAVGLGGTLLPERYIATQLSADAAAIGIPPVPPRTARQLSAWWASVEATVGPATAIRAVFDRVAMPLCGMLGFTAHEAAFDGPVCRVRLLTRRGTPVALVLTTWAARPSTRWADLARHAHDIGASWGFVLAPPFLSVVPTRGHATRQSVDAALPQAIASPAIAQTYALVQAAAFDGAPRTPGERAEPAIDRLLRCAQRYQDAVRVDLQQGVETSLRVLHPIVARTRRPPRAAQPAADPLDQTLTLVYRVLFLLFVESRRLVPADEPVYRLSYAMSRFCRAAAEGAVAGLWDAFAATTRLSRIGCRTDDLHVPPFNGALFARSSAPALEQRHRRMRRSHEARARDEAVQATLVALGSRPGRAGLEAINYRDLGVEQLGAVYERVLDLEHDVASTSTQPARASSPRRHSRARKQTGTFYTPQPLADYVVRRTLAPLTEGATADAILNLRVVDPAMGSGAFLVAACRFLASAYEDALIAEGRLWPTDVTEDERARLRRLVAEKCLWGVDRNPTAVHLARLSLWLTSLARDKPLSFLDHRLRTGDSLVGAWPGDLQRVPTRATRGPTPLPLFDTPDLDDAIARAMQPLQSLNARHDDTVADVRAREADWRRFQSTTSPLHRWRVAANLWCARWFAPASSRPPDAAETRALLDAILRKDRTLDPSHIARRTDDATAIARDRAFFHWPLEFPDVFYGDDGQPLSAPGFDAVIGNPPWEMVRRDEDTGAIEPRAVVRYVRQSGQYPSCAVGHLNLYQAFVDRALALTRSGGRVGLVLPWSLATDDGAAALRRRLLYVTAIDAIVGIDNAAGLFPIHRGLRLMAISATVGRPTERIRACFGVRTAAELDGLPPRGGAPAYPVVLTPGDLRLASGPAMRIPDARRAADLPWLIALTRRFPPLGARDGWHVSFGRELNATDARPHLSTTGIPVVEGKHLSPFVVAADDAPCMAAEQVARMIDRGRVDRPRLAYRDVSGVGNRLTLIAALIPGGMVTTHTLFCLKEAVDIDRQHFLCAVFNSYVLNAVVRLLMGAHVTTTLAEQLPVPVWRGDATDRDIAAMARAIAERRAEPGMAARLQASVARRFELTAGQLQHVLDSFPLVAREERAEVMQAFDAGSSA